MEDATSALYSAFLVDQEGTASSLRGLREVVSAHGLFCSLYTDRGSHYFFTPEAGGKVSKTVLTQVGRALKQLGIEHIAAYSPQARGRSERAFHTLQDRLPKEFKLAGIATVEAANRWLRDTYIAEHNGRFAIDAEQEGSAFVTDATGAWREILCIQEDRTVGQDNTVKWEGWSLQLPPSRLRPHFVKTTVRVHGYPDGRLSVFWGPHRLADYAADGTLIQPEPGVVPVIAIGHAELRLRHGHRIGGGAAHCIPLRNAMPGMVGMTQPNGPSASASRRSNSDGRLAADAASTADPVCGYVDNAKCVVHIPTGAASAEALRFIGSARQ